MAKRRDRLTRDDWIEAARKVLIASGVDDVKVDRLARRMKVTRGSFYWHFKNRQDLLDALLERWEGQNRRELAQIRQRCGSSEAGLAEAVRIWLGEDPSHPVFDMAVRLWGRKDARVLRLVREIDGEWIALFHDMLRDNGRGELENLARARIIYFHQIGYYALAMEETLEQRLEIAPYYSEVLLGERGATMLEELIRGFEGGRPGKV